jgi:small subunit ribosomal protein S3
VGQKVNPIGFRVAVNKNWDSRWFAKKANFGEWLHEDLKIREALKKEFFTACIAKILIERSTNSLRATIFTARPGMLVGRKGAELEKIRQMVAKFATCRDVLVDVKEVKNAETNAQLVAESISMQLERRIGFRRAMKKAIQTAMDMGVEGIKIRCAGRLGGSELARVEQYKDGKTPLHTIRANIDYGFAEAQTPAGKIGVKVWICHKESFEEMNNATNAKTGKAQKSPAR